MFNCKKLTQNTRKDTHKVKKNIKKNIKHEIKDIKKKARKGLLHKSSAQLYTKKDLVITGVAAFVAFPVITLGGLAVLAWLADRDYL